LVGDAVVAPGRESHPQFTLDAPWGTDTVQAVTITPIVDQQAILKFVALTDTTIETLAIWGPAMPPITAPADVGFYLPSGAASMRMNMHYQNLGTSEVRDHSGFELCVTRTPRPNTAGLFTVSATPSIPAGAVRYQSVGTCNIQAPAALSAFSVTPFMHALATHIKVAGPSTTFLDVDYSYQSVKPYPVNKLPIRNGDAMTVTCTYTNGTANVVNFGENLQNELCFAFVAYYPHGSVRCPMSLGVSF
jgi:hypothetical protein